MEIRIRYMNIEFPLIIPNTAHCDEFRGRSVDDIMTPDSLFEDIKRAEADLFDLDSAQVYIVNDAYRPTPTALILDWLAQHNRLNGDSIFIVATGTHAAPTEKQLRSIFGNHLSSLRRRIIIHDSRRAEELIEVGHDNDGSPVLLHRAVAEADRIVVIGSVEPHFFAGYTGGRKSLFPGVCDYATTVRNHNRAVSFEAMPMKLKDNPVDEHLRGLMKLVHDKMLFGIQVVCAADSENVNVYIGQLDDAFQRACRAAEYVYGATVDHSYDLLLAEVLPPLDSNLYQLQKSLENCQRAVTDGGTIVLFSSCHEGIGSSGFYHLADKWRPGMRFTGEEAFGWHKLERVHKINQRVNVCLFSELPDEIPEKVFFSPVRSPQALVDSYFQDNEKAALAVVRDAGHTVLISP